MKMNLKKTRIILKNLLSRFWEKPFSILLLVLLVYGVVGFCLFYYFYKKPLSEKPILNLPSIQFNQDLLKEFVEIWGERAERFQSPPSGLRFDFFKAPMPISTSTPPSSAPLP